MALSYVVVICLIPLWFQYTLAVDTFMTTGCKVLLICHSVGHWKNILDFCFLEDCTLDSRGSTLSISVFAVKSRMTVIFKLWLKK